MVFLPLPEIKPMLTEVKFVDVVWFEGMLASEKGRHGGNKKTVTACMSAIVYIDAAIKDVY